MKRKLLYLLAVSLLAACSAPKYSYNFGHYNYQTAKKSNSTRESITSDTKTVAITPGELVASVSNEPTLSTAPMERPVFLPIEKNVTAQPRGNEHAMTKKEIKREVKQYIRSVKKSNGIESVNATKGIDNDLKLAAIFGAVGIVALIIGGQVFWIIGGVAMIIGVVFFVKWLLRQ